MKHNTTFNHLWNVYCLYTCASYLCDSYHSAQQTATHIDRELNGIAIVEYTTAEVRSYLNENCHRSHNQGVCCLNKGSVWVDDE